MWTYTSYRYLASYTVYLYTSYILYVYTIHVYYTVIAKTNHFFGVHLLFFHRVYRIHLFLLKHLQIVLHIYIYTYIHGNDNNKYNWSFACVYRYICQENNCCRLSYKIIICSLVTDIIASARVLTPLRSWRIRRISTKLTRGYGRLKQFNATLDTENSFPRRADLVIECYFFNTSMYIFYFFRFTLSDNFTMFKAIKYTQIQLEYNNVKNNSQRIRVVGQVELGSLSSVKYANSALVYTVCRIILNYTRYIIIY